MAQQEARQTKQILGTNIRDARKAHRMTQRQLGEAVGAAGPDVSRWETGRVEPRTFYRQRLADELFDGDVAAMYRDGRVEAAA